MGDGYYLHPHSGKMVISGCSDRFIFQPCDWLVDEPEHGKATGGPSRTDGFVAETVFWKCDFALGSRFTIYQPRIAAVPVDTWHR